MSQFDALSLVKRALVDVCPERSSEFEGVTQKTRIEELGLDSVSTLEMVGFIEDEMSVEIPDDSLSKIETLGDLTHIAAQLAA